MLVAATVDALDDASNSPVGFVCVAVQQNSEGGVIVVPKAETFWLDLGMFARAEASHFPL